MIDHDNMIKLMYKSDRQITASQPSARWSDAPAQPRGSWLSSRHNARKSEGNRIIVKRMN
jgi:hypothetical protein